MRHASVEAGGFAGYPTSGVNVRIVRSLAVTATVLSLFAAALPAQTGTGKVQWRGVNGAWSSYNNSGTGSALWNVYTSPYKAGFQINQAPSPLLPPAGTSTFGPTVDIFCVDFIHYANTGTYDAYFTNLGSNAADINTYTRNGRTLQEYLEAAFLAQEIESVGANSAAAGDINGAIWQIMNGEPKYRWTGSGWSATGINNWISLAESNWKTVNANYWVVVTDKLAAGNETGGSQEYLTQVTPEPATLLLLGSGLLAMIAAGVVRRRLV